MSDIKKLYDSEYSKLIKLRGFVDEILKTPVEGSIHIHKKGSYFKFGYAFKDGNDNLNEIYVRKKDLGNYKDQIAVQCAKKVKPVVNNLIHALERNMGSYDDKALSKVYEELCEAYGENVPKPFYSNRLLMEKWKNSDYAKLDYKLEKLVYSTNKGEKVRTKIEALVANILFDMQIPYRYEARLKKDAKIFWPDFTLISPVNGRVFYLEIFGMMTDKNYAIDNLKKINDYNKAGIIQGDKLIIVFDSEDAPFDEESFKQTIRILVLGNY